MTSKSLDYFAKQAGVAGFSIVPINPPEVEYVRSPPKIHKDPDEERLDLSHYLQEFVEFRRV